MLLKFDDKFARAFQFNTEYSALNIGGKYAHPGDINLLDAKGRKRIILNAGGSGNIRLLDENGNTRITLDSSTGDIKLEGADCAEEFDVDESINIDSGTIMVMDNENKLQPCKKPYDKRVAGVVAGGNGTNPGIILGKKLTKNKRLPIALNGTAYCKVDAQYSPIEVGDLLTTSSSIGYAMKAVDPLKAFGAVIGKAMESLHSGRDLIPILVALQ